MTISIYEDVLNMIKGITEFGNRVYADYPEKKQSALPFAVIDEIGHNTIMITEKGEELQAILTYSVMIIAKTKVESRDLYTKINNLFNTYKGTSNSYIPLRNEQGHQAIDGTWRILVDVRGNTFQE